MNASIHNMPTAWYAWILPESTMRANHLYTISWLAISADDHGPLPCWRPWYLACTDKLTGGLILYHFSNGQMNTSRLISIFWDWILTYSTSEELHSGGGPPFTSLPFKQFLKDWTLKYRLVSVTYPKFNGQAELTDKTGKRIVNGNTGAQGS